MKLRDFFQHTEQISTPAFYFDTDVFHNRVEFVKMELPKNSFDIFYKGKSVFAQLSARRD